jgi:hypothetical protein
MNYDIDGTVPFRIDNSNNLSTPTLANLQAMLDESGTNYLQFYGSIPQTFYVGFIFPQNRDITAVYYNITADQYPVTLDTETSVDTTNGFDGTWARRVTAATYSTAVVSPDYRNSIATLSYTSVKAFRMRLVLSGGGSSKNLYLCACHLYGAQSGTGTVDRLRLWHPTLDQELTGPYFDYGDIARSASSTKQFRVKNNSATLTANSPALSFDYLTDASPTLAGQFQLSPDNSTYMNTLTLSNLAAGAISPIVYLRDNVSATAALSLWSGRVKAAAASWV